MTFIQDHTIMYSLETTFTKNVDDVWSHSSRGRLATWHAFATSERGLMPEIYRHVEGLSIVRLSCVVSNWNIYEPINHFCCCSPPYALDTTPIGRRTLRLLRYAGMLHRSSSDFFELLVEGGWPNDSREQ